MKYKKKKKILFTTKNIRILIELGWCHAWHFDLSQIPVTEGLFELHCMEWVSSSNYHVVIGISDPLKSQAQHHHSIKLGLKLIYFN